jgi:hypothetical protein
MGSSKKMHWTAAALVTMFVVLSADADGAPLYAQPSVVQQKRRET